MGSRVHTYIVVTTSWIKMYLKNYFYENMKHVYSNFNIMNTCSFIMKVRSWLEVVMIIFSLTSLLYPRLIIRTDPQWADGRGLLLIPLASISLLVFLFSLPLVILASKIKKKWGGGGGGFIFLFCKKKNVCCEKEWDRGPWIWVYI